MESLRITLCALIVVFICLSGSNDVEGIRRFRRPPLPPPPPLVKVGKDVISLNMKKSSNSGRSGAQTVDIAPLLSTDESKDVSKPKVFNSRTGGGGGTGLLILRRKATASSSRARSLSGFRPSKSVLISGVPTKLEENRRRSNGHSSTLSRSYSNRGKWMALQMALRRQHQRDLLKSQYLDTMAKLEESRRAEYMRSIVPLLYHYKLQKNAADKYYEKYLRTLQLLALATTTNQQNSPSLGSSPEINLFTQSFKNSIYGSLLNNSSFVTTNAVDPAALSESKKLTTLSGDQLGSESHRSDHENPHPVQLEFTSYHRELEKEKRKLLDVFPPPQSEVPFGERTILMVRFPPVPIVQKEDKEKIRLKASYDIDGGITFGGPRWFSFGKPFDPFDHPWYHEKKDEKPKTYVLAEADKQSCNGVIISQNFIYRPSIRFTNSDPKSLAKYKGDLLNGGPSIISQLAKALAEGNRISNSYFLSKNLLGEKKWTHPGKKPPFVIVHLDTYTKKSNDTDALGLEDQIEANYANGTIIYPTLNDPHVLASTKFEFHSVHDIQHIFDQPLAILGDGHGHDWGEVPVHPKGINEIKNFLKLMYRVHQESHDRGRKKIVHLRKLGDYQEKPAFPNSKPLLKNQIQDKHTSWLHTSSVGIRSLSEDDDHFPYDKQPVVDVSQDYSHDHYL